MKIRVETPAQADRVGHDRRDPVTRSWVAGFLQGTDIVVLYRTSGTLERPSRNGRDIGPGHFRHCHQARCHIVHSAWCRVSFGWDGWRKWVGGGGRPRGSRCRYLELSPSPSVTAYAPCRGCFEGPITTGGLQADRSLGGAVDPEKRRAQKGKAPPHRGQPLDETRPRKMDGGR